MPTRSIRSLRAGELMQVLGVGEVVGAVVEPAERDQQERAAQLAVQLVDRAGGDLGAAAVAEQHDGDAAVGPVAGERELRGDLAADGPVVQGRYRWSAATKICMTLCRNSSSPTRRRSHAHTGRSASGSASGEYGCTWPSTRSSGAPASRALTSWPPSRLSRNAAFADAVQVDQVGGRGTVGGRAPGVGHALRELGGGSPPAGAVGQHLVAGEQRLGEQRRPEHDRPRAGSRSCDRLPCLGGADPHDQTPDGLDGDTEPDAGDGHAAGGGPPAQPGRRGERGRPDRPRLPTKSSRWSSGPSSGNARTAASSSGATRPGVQTSAGAWRRRGQHQLGQGPRGQRPEREHGAFDEGAGQQQPDHRVRDMPGRRAARGRMRPAASDSPASSSRTTTGDIGSASL